MSSWTTILRQAGTCRLAPLGMTSDGTRLTLRLQCKECMRPGELTLGTAQEAAEFLVAAMSHAKHAFGDGRLGVEMELAEVVWRDMTGTKYE